MFGWINDCIEWMIISKFGVSDGGEETWQKIKQVACCEEVENGGFLRYKHYEDSLTLDLILASSSVLDMSIDDVLYAFGYYHIEYIKFNGYSNLLECLGSNLREWLSNLNQLHDHFQSSYPKGFVPPIFWSEDDLESPSSFIRPRSSNSQSSLERRYIQNNPKSEHTINAILVHYYSKRGSLFVPMVHGSLIRLAKEYFDIDINMQLLEIQNEDIGIYHTTWRITTLNIYDSYKLSSRGNKRLSSISMKISNQNQNPTTNTTNHNNNRSLRRHTINLPPTNTKSSSSLLLSAAAAAASAAAASAASSSAAVATVDDILDDFHHHDDRDRDGNNRTSVSSSEEEEDQEEEDFLLLKPPLSSSSSKSKQQQSSIKQLEVEEQQHYQQQQKCHHHHDHHYHISRVEEFVMRCYYNEDCELYHSLTLQHYLYLIDYWKTHQITTTTTDSDDHDHTSTTTTATAAAAAAAAPSEADEDVRNNHNSGSDDNDNKKQQQHHRNQNPNAAATTTTKKWCYEIWSMKNGPKLKDLPSRLNPQQLLAAANKEKIHDGYVYFGGHVPTTNQYPPIVVNSNSSNKTMMQGSSSLQLQSYPPKVRLINTISNKNLDLTIQDISSKTMLYDVLWNNYIQNHYDNNTTVVPSTIASTTTKAPATTSTTSTTTTIDTEENENSNSSPAANTTITDTVVSDSSYTTTNKAFMRNMITEFDVPTEQLLSDGKLVIEFRVCRNDYNHFNDYDDGDDDNNTRNDDLPPIVVYHTFTLNDLKTTTTQQLYDLVPKTFDPILIEIHCCDNTLNDVGDDEEDL